MDPGDTALPHERARGPAIVFLAAVGWLVVLAMVALLVLLWRYTVQTGGSSMVIAALFSGAASLLLGLILVIAAVGAINTWRGGRPFGPHSIKTLVRFAAAGCAFMLIKGVIALVTDGPDTPLLAMLLFAAGIGIAVAFEMLLRHESVTSWCAPSTVASE